MWYNGPMPLLHCSKCKTEKDCFLFKRDNRKGSGRSSWCRLCDNRWHREQRKSRSPAQIERDRLRGRTYNREYYYGITPDTYARMLQQYNDVCAICKQPETRIVKGSLSSLSVDHDHETGNIRGLLCDSCNKVLGLFQDAPMLFRSAADYLEQWGHK